jgi:deoxyadenosine/deoxycytidine kinase/NTP pyrophosphatase (non-canonical NTP hydrolase)
VIQEGEGPGTFPAGPHPPFILSNERPELDVLAAVAAGPRTADLLRAEATGAACRITFAEHAVEADLLIGPGVKARDALHDFDLVWLDESLNCNLDDPVFVALAAAAAAMELPIFASRPGASALGLRVERAQTLSDALRAVRSTTTAVAPRHGLIRLQRHYARMAAIREYGTASPQDTLLLLNEEIGELAHALRNRLKLGRTHLERNIHVAEEIADVQLYLLHMANITQTPLAAAVHEKEKLNHERWQAKNPTVLGEKTPQYLAIEGIIGSGKTTVAGLCADRLGIPATFERVDDHPFLARFYTDPARYAVEVELAFILMRWHELRDRLTEERIVADYAPFKDIVFSQVLLSGYDLDLVRNLFDHFWQRAPRPTVTVYLEVGVELALARIQKRARPYEMEIDLDYLCALRDSYHRNLGQLGERVVPLRVRGEWTPEQVADAVVDAAVKEGFGVA